MDMCLLVMAKSLPDFGVEFTSMRPIMSCGGLMVVCFDFLEDNKVKSNVELMEPFLRHGMVIKGKS
jgi:hypothetical protein